MKVIIERAKDLFDEDIVEEMLDLAAKEDGCCHYNSAIICKGFEDWDCIEYVEGYLDGGHYKGIGHAINSYKDSFGTIHYFDITQEYRLKNHLKEDFCKEFEIVKTFSSQEIDSIFSKDGKTHLVSVPIIR